MSEDRSVEEIASEITAAASENVIESNSASSQSSSTDTASEIESENNTASSHSSDAISSQSSGSVFSSENLIKYELITGKRRDCVVLNSIDEKQLYVKNKKLRDGSTAYTCREKTCKARVYLFDGLCFHQKNNIHNHETKETQIAELKIETKIKSDCAEVQASSSQTTSRISDVREIFNNSMVE